MLVLESLEHAEKHGLQPFLTEVVGYRNTCDAYHMTSPTSRRPRSYQGNEVGFR